MYAGGPSSPACATSPERPCLVEYAREFRRRMAELGRVEADADQPVTIALEQRQRRFERCERIFFRQMAQEAQDQLARQPALFRIRERALDAGDDGLDRHAARGMRLRIEEQLGMDDVVRERAFAVRGGHVVEVLLGQQHARARVVDVEERLQIGERVRGAQRVDRIVGKLHAVALREREDQLGLERTFDMDMQLGFRRASDLVLECRSHGVVMVGQRVGEACTGTCAFASTACSSCAATEIAITSGALSTMPSTPIGQRIRAT